jgi:hypothetical protein
MSILLKAIHKINIIPTKIPITFFIEVQKNPKICMEAKPPKAKAILSKRSKTGVIPDLKTYYKDIVTKTARY